MIILYLLLIPILYILVKLILNLIVKKYGKFSYDGFSAAGFAYHSKKDIFYSTRNAWQKNFGYTRYYDILAPAFRMIIDTEPIRFWYNNKNWLITFWKGQYGIVTGAEIGIYCTKQRKINKKTIYLPVDDQDMLNMDLILYKNGKIITKVINVKHWWLAVFKLGMFSNPEELSMDINITFPNREMLNAFLISFINLGYTNKDFIVIDNTFCFKYIKPRTRQVWTRTWFTDRIQQFLNRKNVKLYNQYLEDLIDDNKIDDSEKTDNKNLILVNEWIPDLLKNSPSPQNKNSSQQIAKKIWNEKSKNVVFLEDDIYSKLRSNRI